MSKKKNKQEQEDQQSKSTETTETMEHDNTQESGDVMKAEAKLQKELEDMGKQLEEAKDKYIRLFADFENFRKRSVKERIELMDAAGKDTLAAILPVLDDFDRAKANSDNENSEEQFSEGVSLVYQKLYATLTNLGLKPMETTGEMFDPELHEAVAEIPAASNKEKGKIIDTVEKGYLFKDRILRHAKVVVGK